MPDSPTVHELERRLSRLEQRMDAGFDRLEAAIQAQVWVQPEVFVTDQTRQDDAIANLAGKLMEQGERSEAREASLRHDVQKQITKIQAQFVGGLLVVLTVGVIANLLS